MKKFDHKFIDINSFLEKSHKPDFNNILKVLKKEAPNRPTLFEFILNGDLVEAFTKHKTYEGTEEEIACKKLADIITADMIMPVCTEAIFHLKMPESMKPEKAPFR